MSKMRSLLENLVILAIVAVLAQTFLEDLAVVRMWSLKTRTILMIAGFSLDLFFTVEFVVRGYDAWRHHRFYHYFRHDRGWIDLLASLPLLVLNSGPAFLAWLVGGISVGGAGGMLNVLKVVKAIRIARVLRLLRILKIFRRIKNTESVMAQRHVAMVSAISVSVFVFTLLVLSGLGTLVPFPSMETDYQNQIIASAEYLVANQALTAPDRQVELAAFAGTHPGILAVEQAGSVRYSKHDQQFFDTNFGPGDYTVLTSGGLSVFVDLMPLNRAQATANLRYFVIIVMIVLVYLFIYSPHFAITVSDPIHVMRRGMNEKSYSLEVKVPPEFKDDDIYQLAAEYNRVFLPMKDRENAVDEGESGGSALTLGSIEGLFD